ncbi:MAG: Cobalt/magnesium transport protein CorA [Planctomycetes bacterium]|nr:Cobalt/magnesium transport protein CorA [Planctomycetota bacterium]
MSRHRRPRTPKHTPGQAPGTLNVPDGAIATHITVIRYAPHRHERFDGVDVRRLRSLVTPDGVVWIDLTGCRDLDTFHALIREFELPWLAMEDVFNTPQRPKVEPFGDARFVIVRQIQDPGTVEMDQISLWFHGNVVFTFQHRSGDCFDPIRKRLLAPESQLRRRGADYLAYRLVDSCVDSFFPEMERLMDRMEDLEQSVLESPSRKALLTLHALKRDLRVLEKVILPLRDAVGSLTRDDAVFAADTRPFLRDAHDHTNQLVEQAHLLDVLATDVGDLALGSIEIRLNVVMRRLAAVTFVLMPLSLVTSFYGMNFENMPELKWAWSYPALIACLLSAAAFLMWWVWKKGYMEDDN